MKKEFTIFGCDNCANEITIVSRSGFPYKDGWVYLYHFDSKLKPLCLGFVRNTNLTDKHFCCALCMKEFLCRVIDTEHNLENPQ